MASPEADYANAASQILSQLGAAQAQGILSAGQATAAGQAQRGAIWGGTLNNLGQTIANLPMQLAQQKEAQQQMQLRTMQMAAMKQSMEAQQRANQVVAHLKKNDDGTIDTLGAVQQFAGAGLPLDEQERFAKTLDAFNDRIKSANQSKIDHMAAVANTLLEQHPQGQPLTPDTVHLGFAAMKAVPAFGITDQDEQQFVQMMAQGQEPEALLKAIRAQGSEWKKQQAKIAEEMGKPVKLAPGEKLINPATKETLAEGGARPLKDKSELAFDAVDPNSPTREISANALDKYFGAKAEGGYQAKSVLLNGKPAEVMFNSHTGRYTDADGNDVSSNVKPMPPASVVYPQAKSDKLIKVEHKDPETGRTVIEWLPMSEVRGQKFEKGTSATTESRLASAQAVNQTGQDIIAKLSDPAVKRQLGPAMGRFNSVREFIGNPPPELAEIAGAIESYALANMGVHGMRSAQGAEQIKKLLDQKHTPESLIATIKGLNAFSQHFMQNEGRAVGTPTPTSVAPSGGGPSYQDYLRSRGKP